METKMIGYINGDNPTELDEEQARQLGSQMGDVTVAAIVNMDLLRYIGPAFLVSNQSSSHDTFITAYINAVASGLVNGIEGSRNRAEVARRLLNHSLGMRDKVHKMGLANGKKNIAEIDALLETEGLVRKAAEALLKPIEALLRAACVASKKTSHADRAFHQSRSEAEDKARDTTEDCGDPSCQIHGTH